MSRFYFIKMAIPNAITEGFHELLDPGIPGAELVAPFRFRNRVVELANRIRYHKRLRRFLDFLPHEFWGRWHVLNSLEINDDEPTYAVFMPGTDIDRLILPGLLKRMRAAHPNLKYALLLFDSLDSPLQWHGWNRVQEVFPLFDLVASFDAGDAKRLGIPHFNDPYAARRVSHCGRFGTDVFFVGHDKGRLDKLCRIADRFSSAGISYRILVAAASDAEKAKQHGLTVLDSRLSYAEMLEQALDAKCLLEVLVDGQHSSSLRYYEAAVYNKLLLSDNPGIKSLPVYHCEYMKCFEQADDIDTAWLKDTQKVDYHYRDEFSVRRLIELVEAGCAAVESEAGSR
jgi:hypothetical protein